MFFFPFSDDNPSSSRPFVCYILIGLCAFVFLWQFTLPQDLYRSAVYSFGVVPASLLGDKPSTIPASLTIVSSMFMHGGWMHLLSNMVYLWIFGEITTFPQNLHFIWVLGFVAKWTSQNPL